MSKSWTFAIGSVAGGVQAAVFMALSNKSIWMAFLASLAVYHFAYSAFVYFDKKA